MMDPRSLLGWIGNSVWLIALLLCPPGSGVLPNGTQGDPIGPGVLGSERATQRQIEHSQAAGNGGITVIGKAHLEIAPNRFIVPIRLVANGKTMALARGEHQKKLDKIRDVFNEMDYPNLKLGSSGVAITNSAVQNVQELQIMMMNGAPEQTPEAGIYLVEELSFEFAIPAGASRSQIEESVAAFLDRAIEEKLELGGNPAQAIYYPGQEIPDLVRMTHDQVDSHQTELNAAAFADARRQAEELAKLAGAQLGKVLEVKGGFVEESPDPFGGSPSFMRTCKLGQKIKLESSLEVSFELQSVR